MRQGEYWRFLASALPPSELGGAALRRIRRESLRRIRSITGPDPRAPIDLVARLKLPRVADLAERMRSDRAARGPVEPSERAALRDAIVQHFPDHAKDVCARADRILSGELSLFGEWREHARGELAPGIAAIAWTRDPIHGAVAPERESRTIERDLPGMDVRAMWEAARLAHVATLAQAHVVCGLPGTEGARGAREPGIYARAAVLHVRDFIATQPVGWGIHWTCAMEASLRVLNLAPALLLVRDAPELDPTFWHDALALLWRHGRFVDDALEDGQAVPNNHLLANLAALSALGCLYPELPDAPAWRARLADFSRELVRQTTPEGLSFEASLAYHGFATELGLVVEAIAHRQGTGLAQDARERLAAMCAVVECATLPDGRLPHVGDDDGSRAMPWGLHESLSLPHVPAIAAALGLPTASVTLVPDVLWVAGLPGLRALLARAPADVARTRSFAVSGLAVLARGDLGASLWAGDNGQRGLGGHAHNDKLSCEIVLGNRRIVIDPGCPTYFADPDERNRYRSTAAHPTATIDGQEQGPVPAARPFLLPESARARLVRVGPSSAWADHRGYERLRPGCVHRREVTLLSHPEAICVTDRFLGEGSHVVELHWPLAMREVDLRAPRHDERALLDALGLAPSGEGRVLASRLVSIVPPDGPGAVIAFGSELALELSLSESTWSPGYGRRALGRTVVVRARVSLPAALTTFFLPRAGADAHRG